MRMGQRSVLSGRAPVSSGCTVRSASGLRDGDKVVFDGFSDVAVGKEVKAKDGDPLQLQQNGKSLF